MLSRHPQLRPAPRPPTSVTEARMLGAVKRRATHCRAHVPSPSPDGANAPVSESADRNAAAGESGSPPPAAWRKRAKVSTEHDGAALAVGDGAALAVGDGTAPPPRRSRRGKVSDATAATIAAVAVEAIGADRRAANPLLVDGVQGSEDGNEARQAAPMPAVGRPSSSAPGARRSGKARAAAASCGDVADAQAVSAGVTAPPQAARRRRTVAADAAPATGGGAMVAHAESAQSPAGAAAPAAMAAGPVAAPAATAASGRRRKGVSSASLTAKGSSAQAVAMAPVVVNVINQAPAADAAALPVAPPKSERARSDQEAKTADPVPPAAPPRSKGKGCRKANADPVLPVAVPKIRGKGGRRTRTDPRVTPVLAAAEAAALRGEALLDLGELVTGTLVRRPSASVKSPYVADVRLLPPQQRLPDGVAAGTTDAAAAAIVDAAGGGGELVLAHAPALDCAGMIAPGALLRLSVNAGAAAAAAPRKAGASTPATSHAIQLVEEARPGGAAAMVGCHPALGERLAAELLRRGCLGAALGAYEGVESQRTFGSTRVDFVLRMADGSRTLLEVKNVVCADFPDGEGGVPAGRTREGVYTTRVETGRAYTPTALFPHGAVKPQTKVVSDRAIKHVWELTQLHGSRIGDTHADAEGAAAGAAPGNAAGKAAGAAAMAIDATRAHDQQAGCDAASQQPLQLRSGVLFLVNRADCAAFRPCHEADPLFASVLKAAQEAGVALLAYDVEWRGGRAFAGKRLPVTFHPSVSAAYDADWLRRVLEFNATDPRQRSWRAATKRKEKAEAEGEGEDGQEG